MNIYPASGIAVPSDWYKRNIDSLIVEVAQTLDYPVYRYTDYKTGIFSNGRQPGVMLHFINPATGEAYFAFFNADLKRKRKSKNGIMGDMLPGNRFHVGDRSAFRQFWLRTGLATPDRPSEWHKSMSRLKPLIFVAQQQTNGKLDKSSINTLNLSADEVTCFFSDNPAIDQRQASVNSALSNGVNNRRQEVALTSGDKGSAESVGTREPEGDSKCVSEKVRASQSACDSNCVSEEPRIKSSSMTGNVVSISTKERDPSKQSNDEWWADYDSAD